MIRGGGILSRELILSIRSISYTTILSFGIHLHLLPCGARLESTAPLSSDGVKLERSLSKLVGHIHLSCSSLDRKAQSTDDRAFSHRGIEPERFAQPTSLPRAFWIGKAKAHMLIGTGNWRAPVRLTFLRKSLKVIAQLAEQR
jgi:hypothetical protein